jgi:membrane protein insertase Oxa1/YidC/SpoIIIJ
MLLVAPAFSFVAPLTLLASVFVGMPHVVALWSMIAAVCGLVWWTGVYAVSARAPLYALLSPVGAIVVFYIFLRAVSRGQRVAWKGRNYVSG